MHRTGKRAVKNRTFARPPGRFGFAGDSKIADKRGGESVFALTRTGWGNRLRCERDGGWLPKIEVVQVPVILSAAQNVGRVVAPDEGAGLAAGKSPPFVPYGLVETLIVGDAIKVAPAASRLGSRDRPSSSDGDAGGNRNHLLWGKKGEVIGFPTKSDTPMIGYWHEIGVTSMSNFLALPPGPVR